MRAREHVNQLNHFNCREDYPIPADESDEIFPGSSAPGHKKVVFSFNHPFLVGFLLTIVVQQSLPYVERVLQYHY
jgi:hypothetical protein